LKEILKLEKHVII